MMPSRNIFMILCFTLWGQKGCSWSILVRNHKHPVQIKNIFRKLLKQIVSPRLFVSNVDSAVRSLGWSIKLADGWNVEPEQVRCRSEGLWKYLIFLWWTKCRGKMQNQGYETLQPGKRKENERVQRKVKPCDELPPNLRSQSNTIPENESSWNRYLLHICIYMTWSIISDIFQHCLVTFFFTSSGCCAPFPQGREETAAKICEFWEDFFVFGLCI